MTFFETKRLRCLSITPEQYADFEKGVEPKWDGFSNPYKHLIEEPTPLHFRIPRVKANPDFADIAIILAISKDSNKVVGSAGLRSSGYFF